MFDIDLNGVILENSLGVNSSKFKHLIIVVAGAGAYVCQIPI